MSIKGPFKYRYEFKNGETQTERRAWLGTVFDRAKKHWEFDFEEVGVKELDDGFDLEFESPMSRTIFLTEDPSDEYSPGGYETVLTFEEGHLTDEWLHFLENNKIPTKLPHKRPSNKPLEVAIDFEAEVKGNQLHLKADTAGQLAAIVGYINDGLIDNLVELRQAYREAHQIQQSMSLDPK